MTTSEPVLRSGWEIRRALRELGWYDVLKQIDTKLSSRRDLSRATIKFTDLTGLPAAACAICNYQLGEDTRTIQIAHIQPVHGRGTNSANNLIPLCSTGSIGKGSSRPVGCHNLFDAGHASVVEVMYVRRHMKSAQYVQIEPLLRKKMVKRRDAAYVVPQNNYFRQAKALRRKLGVKDPFKRTNAHMPQTFTLTDTHLSLLSAERRHGRKGGLKEL